MRRKRFGLIVGALMITVMAAAPGAGAQDQGSATPSAADERVTFTIGVTGDLNSVNPLRGIDTTEAFVTGLMYDGLLRLAQPDYEPEASMVEDWSVSEDGLTWTFSLRDDLTWSDGTPITADDFAWTGNFIAENDISSWSDGYRFTESIEAVDERTIVWTTRKPTLVPGLPGYNLLLPKHVWGDMTVKETKEFKNFPEPVVSGPFELVEWVQGEFWRMEARDDYWEGRPYIDELIFRVYNNDEALVQALLKGAVDYAQVPTASLFETIKDRPGIETATNSAEAFWQLSFNLADDKSSTAHPAVRDVNVRHAVEHAIDRQTLIDRILRGYATPGSTPIVPFYEYWHWEPPGDVARTFDIAKANEILDEAGYADTDGDGIREMPGGGDPFEWRLFIATTDTDGIKAGPFLREWLGEIGIQASIRTMTDSKLYDLWYDFDWDLILYSWGTGPDPDFLLSSFTSDQCGYWSDTCYANPTYDELYLEQQTTLDRAARQAIVHEMQQIFYADAPEIVLWYPNWFEAWRGDRWEGFLRWPEPDGAAFWGNQYSVMSVRPAVEGQATTAATSEGGAPILLWVGIAGAIVLVAGITLLRRRKSDAYHA